jgi:hypothetical protein
MALNVAVPIAESQMPSAIEPEGSLDFRIPAVRHFIACERIETALGSPQKEYSLHNVIHAIRLWGRRIYPHIHPLLSLFAQMTNGRGSHSFQIQKIHLDDESTIPARLLYLIWAPILWLSMYTRSV